MRSGARYAILLIVLEILISQIPMYPQGTYTEDAIIALNAVEEPR
jgi:hypothetical protein